MHRIECVPCGNRAFSNREALQQHLKTSSAYHPHCEKCDKRFSSESGLEAHMAAKHPPTFDCARCSRSYRHSFALEDHYRGSPYHPNCSRCGKGFKDESELEEHRQTVHVQRPCTPCGGELVYQDQDSLERHYVNSERHSKCTECNKGFRDGAALRAHANLEHSPSTPSPPQTPSLEPSIAPSPPRPEIPSKDALSTSPTAVMSHAYANGLVTTPSPKSSNLFKDFTSFGSRRIGSPDMSRLSLSFGGANSPLLAVQPSPFSPAGLIPPGREANELWNSKMNVQVPSPLNVTKPVAPVTTSPTLSRSRFSMALDTEQRPLARAMALPAASSAANGAAAASSSAPRFGFRPILSRPAASLPTLPAAASIRLDDGMQVSSSSRASASAIVSQYPISRQYTSPPRMSIPPLNAQFIPSSSLTTARDLSPTLPSPPLHHAIASNSSTTVPPHITSRVDTTELS
ncbi:hypothetical protein BKA70DRAFT_201246 [Coprinopsis sp. MPI-PUGE-AT-0042]|nr:hypothetical protein BKA70DRAFT_201246 [Coprinopsis sp. MPI-PUGE-AT-0042]